MMYRLVTTSQTLEPVLQRALQPEQLETHESVAEISNEALEAADAIVFDGATANFMELFANKHLFESTTQLVILTEKPAAMAQCFPQAAVLPYPVTPADIATAVQQSEFTSV